jgi:ATP-dependent Clp protease ATP-binding subunit ClpA
MTTQTPPLTNIASEVLNIAAYEAAKDKSAHTTTRHILIAMLLEGTNDGADLLARAGLTVEKLRTR